MGGLKLRFVTCIILLTILATATYLSFSNSADGDMQVFCEPLHTPTSQQLVSATATPQLDWNFTINSELRGFPTIAELGGDEGLEILFSADDYKLYCINSTGGLKWSYTFNTRPNTPTVADVDNDELPEILVGTSGIGRLYCLNTVGGLEWSYLTDGGISATPCVANLDDDPILEILFGSINDKFYCIDGYGDFEWDFIPRTDVIASACVVNIDGEDCPEILVGEIEDYFYCLGVGGYSKWTRNLGGTGVIHSSCFVADIDGDGGLEILVSSINQELYCLNSNGATRWTYTDVMFTPFCSTPTVADLDEADGLETIVCSWDEVHCVNSTGGKIWNYEGEGIIRSSQCIVDIDGDGNLEILVGKGDFDIDPGLLCLSSSGVMEWTYDTDNEIESAPCAADVDGDGAIEVLFVSSDTYYDIGILHCLSVVGAPLQDSSYCWPSIGFMGDIGRTGNFIDIDSDMLTNNYETSAGSSLYHADTDTDNRTDYQEFLEATDPTLDLVSPRTINNLVVVESSSNSVTLNWTAPGDNGDSGNATDYILRYSTEDPVTQENWGASNIYVEDWLPLPGGSLETHDVTDLSPSTTYWFALVAADETPNNSGVSNSPEAKTKSATPPLAFPIIAGVGLSTFAIVVILNRRK